MYSLKTIGIALLFSSLLPPLSFAQENAHWFERGLVAYESRQFEAAEEAFRKGLKKESKHAEGHYMLAKSLLAQGDKKQADRSLKRALRNAPDTIKYLELRLEIGFPNEPILALRTLKLNALAGKMLAIDSLNAAANVHMGYTRLREWNRWRDRLSIRELNPIAVGLANQPAPTNLSQDQIDQTRIESLEDKSNRPRDAFDLERHESMGHTSLDLSERAEKAFPKAEFYLQRALRSEPANRKAFNHLATLYIAHRDFSKLLVLAESVTLRQPDHYQAWLISGYVHYKQGRLTEAENRFASALQHMPPSLRDLYEDPDRILNKDGRRDKAKNKQFNTASFWQHRDPVLLTASNERLLEHYARLTYADLVFSEPKLDMAGRDSERGDIYIRFGEPTREYFLSNAMADCKTFTYNNFHIFEYPTNRFVFGNAYPTLNEFTLYSPCAQAFSSLSAIHLDHVILAKETILKTPDRFDYEPAGGRIEFPYLASVFKDAAGAIVYIPYGVPLQGKPADRDIYLSIQSGAFLLNEEQGIVTSHRQQVESLKRSSILPFDAATLWLDTQRLEAGPGAYTLSVEFSTGVNNAGGFHRSEVAIPDFTNDRLVMSDILLAYGIEEVTGPEPEPSAYFIERNNSSYSASALGCVWCPSTDPCLFRDV